MDFREPHLVVGSTLDAALLMVLARAETQFTGRELAHRIGRESHGGVLLALRRLTKQGIVLQGEAGRAKLYRLNRDHVAAPWIQGLTGLRQQLMDRIRNQISSWTIQPRAAAVFGSVARGEAGPESDLDLFLLRPSLTDMEVWDEQVGALTDAITRWSGNICRELEFDENDLGLDVDLEPVIRDILDQGIEVAGSLATLRRLARR